MNGGEVVMSTDSGIGSWVLLGIGTSISLGMFAGILFLIDMVIPLGRFFLWFGMASSGVWTLISFQATIGSMMNDDSGEMLLLNLGLSAASMSAFGYLVFG